jgi:dTDP-glucose 4,6-dehydratase
MNKIIITGGLGFIGTNLINKLVKDKNNIILNIDKITYCSNHSTNINYHKIKNYFFKSIDLSANSNLLNKVILDFKPDIIFHLAAESHVDSSLKKSIIFFDTNLMGTLNLLMSVKSYLNKFRNKYKNFRFIHVGTDEIYGDLELKSKKKFNENSNILPNNPYSASKACGVVVARTWFKNFQLPVIITNSVNNFGIFQFPEKFIPRSILTSLFKKKIEVYGKGKNIRSWIHVDDHVNALILVAKKGKVGESYNISTNFNISNIKLARIIKDILKSKNIITKIYFVKDRLGHDKRYSVDNNKIKKLGWKYNSNILEKFAETVEWYLDKKNLNYFKNLKKEILRKGL